MWYIPTTEYYSALKISELSSHKKTRRKFKYLFLSERSQFEKATVVPTTGHSGQGRPAGTGEVRDCGGWGGAGTQSTEDFRAETRGY